MKRFACLLLAVLLTVSLCGCGGTQESRLELFAMDTYMVITAEGGDTEETVQAASREISRLESVLSRTIDTSSVSRLNTEGSAVLDEDTSSLLAAALTYSEETGGAFDVTIAPLVELWGITSDDPRVPSQEEIDALLPLVGSEHIHLDGREATLDEDCAIDLGGIAKGFASDKAAELLTNGGADRACANLGGNVYVYSQSGRDAWNVAIQGKGRLCVHPVADGPLCGHVRRLSAVFHRAGRHGVSAHPRPQDRVSRAGRPAECVHHPAPRRRCAGRDPGGRLFHGAVRHGRARRGGLLARTQGL